MTLKFFCVYYMADMALRDGLDHFPFYNDLCVCLLSGSSKNVCAMRASMLLILLYIDVLISTTDFTLTDSKDQAVLARRLKGVSDKEESFPKEGE